ncbi:hypothetical protein [Fimbriiglobus ruber]|uniref:EF-hand domain-containing protein n=1 Tax=Fimbriiglobus ruber TaxID=1908690 RepID=A0A225E023_9BACT|nr:hypothetical protein [Fimbriiglobus ruber]OWK47100.1 hypothetical protein FRUB_00799 [Fimbriiglobus ruber]
MSPATLCALLVATVVPHAPVATTDEILVRNGNRTARIAVVVETPTGPLAKREAILLKGWSPTAEGSDPLEHLLSDGHLLRIETAAPSPYAEPLTRAIATALDTNGDGTLSRSELDNAEKILLTRFDADGDGCVTPLEIVPDLLTAKPTAAESDLTINVVRAGRPLPSGFAGKRETSVTLRIDGSRSVSQFIGGMIDSRVTGVVARPEIPRPLLRPGREKEHERFKVVAAEVVTLTVRPQARGWFELLDADGDGQLSARELRVAWMLLADQSELKAAFIPTPDFATPVVSLTLAPGVATRPPARLTKAPLPARGPDWFRALDRNGDGDVSRREFVGTAERFRFYDANGDGLISADEADAGDRKLKQEHGSKS